MRAMDLTQVGPGFSDAVATSQRVFRAGLDALARPGRIVALDSDAAAPRGVQPAACALLLALLDQDTALHVSTAHDAGAAAYFRFHTGCALTDIAAQADFLLLAAHDPWPDLAALRNGGEYAPDQSATLVREVSSFSMGLALKLSGPGIEGSTALHAPELAAGFVAQWQAARARFPRGVGVVERSSVLKVRS